jgi:putative FmdB family regulatory protein
MSNYEFVCKKCGHRFDVRESIAQHDAHKDKCPKCGSTEVQQQFVDIQVKTSKKT